MSAARLSVFPAFHRVEGKAVLVVGEAAAAAAKIRLLLETEAHIRLVAAAPSDEVAGLVIAHDVEHRPRPFQPSDLDGAILVFAASGNRDEDEPVVAAARARNIPVNAVDCPDLCDFYTPAIVNRAPVAVAITSTGAGPVLTQQIRGRIEAMLPVRLGALAGLAETFRPAAERMLPKGGARRRFWSSFFSGPVADESFAGRPDAARRLASRLLNGPAEESGGFVWLVGAGPGSTDLLTIRAQRLLQEADVIVHDALVPEDVVSMGRRDAERIHVGKRKGRHSHSQADINRILVEQAAAGRRVVRLKAGDPLVFGRAGEEMAALRAAGVPFEVVPGVTAALAAAAEAQIPLTLRGVASSLVFASGESAGGDVLPDWAALAASGATVAVYMGGSVAAGLADRLMRGGLPGTTPVAVVESASRTGSRRLAGTLAGLPALAERHGLDGPVLILIGNAVAEGALADAEPLAGAAAMAA